MTTDRTIKHLPCGRPVTEDQEISSDQSKLNPPKDSQKMWPKIWSDKLNHYIALNDLNQSDARNNILTCILMYQNKHFTIQALIKIISDQYPSIGAATVYRNVPLLVEAGLIRETLTDEAGQKYYEIATDSDDEHHDHIVCTDCNRIFEFHDDRIEKAQEQVSTSMNFYPVKHRHVIFSSCWYLKNKPKQ